MTINQHSLTDLTDAQLGDLYQNGDLAVRHSIDDLRLARRNAAAIEHVKARAGDSPIWFQVKKLQWRTGWDPTYERHPFEVCYRTLKDVESRGRYKSDRAGTAGNYATRDEAIAAAQGAGWHLVRDWDEACEQARPQLDAKRAERRRPPVGRPEIGQPINIRLGDELLAAVDAKADRLGISRAELIRMMLADAMQSEMS